MSSSITLVQSTVINKHLRYIVSTYIFSFYLFSYSTSITYALMPPCNYINRSSSRNRLKWNSIWSEISYFFFWFPEEILKCRSKRALNHRYSKWLQWEKILLPSIYHRPSNENNNRVVITIKSELFCGINKYINLISYCFWFSEIDLHITCTYKSIMNHKSFASSHFQTINKSFTSILLHYYFSALIYYVASINAELLSPGIIYDLYYYTHLTIMLINERLKCMYMIHQQKKSIQSKN